MGITSTLFGADCVSRLSGIHNIVLLTCLKETLEQTYQTAIPVILQQDGQCSGSGHAQWVGLHLPGGEETFF